MKNTLKKQVFLGAKSAQKTFRSLSPKQKKQLENAWDIEHAYYSSALEGSKIDKKDFEKLAKQA